MCKKYTKNMVKTCKKCLKTQDISNFHISRTMKDNHMNMCKSCFNLYYRHRREKLLEKEEPSEKIKSLKEKYKNGIPKGTIENMVDTMMLRMF